MSFRPKSTPDLFHEQVYAKAPLHPYLAQVKLLGSDFNLARNCTRIVTIERPITTAICSAFEQLMNPMEHECTVRLMVGGDADRMSIEGKSVSEQSVYSRLSMILPDIEDRLYRGWEIYAQIQSKHLDVPDELNVAPDPDPKKLPLFIFFGINGTF